MIKATISFKILAIILASILTVLLSTVMAIGNIRGISASMKSTVEAMNADVNALFEVSASVNDIGSTVEKMMREKDADLLETLYNDIEKMEALAVEKIDAFGTDGDALKAVYVLFDNECSLVVESILLGDNGSARQSYIEKVTPLKADVIKEISALQALKGNRMNEMVDVRTKNGATSSIILTFILAFLCLAIGMSGLIISKNITASVKQVVSRLKEISEGDGDLTARLEGRGNDEIAELTGYFNTFTDNLAAMVRVVQDSLQSLTGTSHDLVANTEETAAAVNQISANVESFKIRTEKQGKAIDETAVSMESLTGGLVKLNGLIEEQGGSVTQSSAAVEQMVANVRSVTGNVSNLVSLFSELMGSADIGKNRLHEVVGLVSGIAEQSQALSETNGLIASIAAQTNLLAMNAAIEAAHAGEAGQGFSVVADEIRKLAENSAAQSKATSTVLKGVRNKITEVVRSSGVAESTFETILSMIEKLSHLAEEVKAAMNEQSKGNAQVLEAIRKINDISTTVQGSSAAMRTESTSALEKIAGVRRLSDEFRAGMDEISIGTGEINKAIGEIRQLGQDNKESINLAHDASSRFKS